MTLTVRRVGVGLGVGRLVEGHQDLAEVVDLLEGLEFDSFWVSDVPGSYAPDPIVALGFAAARTRKLKLGSSVLIGPGFTPTRLAKQLATVDLLSGGRFFPVLGLGSPDPDVLGSIGVKREDRGPILEELLPLARRIWAEEEVTHRGDYFSVTGFRPQLRPIRRGLSVWLGGRSGTELRRAGRLGDGWLASFATPEEIAASVPQVLSSADDAGRTFPVDHVGVLLLYSLGPLSEDAIAFGRWRRPDLGDALIPVGGERLHSLLNAYQEAGASKFILVPAQQPSSWSAELTALHDIVGAGHPAGVS